MEGGSSAHAPVLCLLWKTGCLGTTSSQRLPWTLLPLLKLVSPPSLQLCAGRWEVPATSCKRFPTRHWTHEQNQHQAPNNSRCVPS